MTSDPFDVYKGLDPASSSRPDWDELGPTVLAAVDERARTAMTTQLTPEETSTPAHRRTHRRRRHAVPLIAACILLAVAAVGLLLTVRGDGDDLNIATPPNAQPPGGDDTTGSARVLSEREATLVGGFKGTVKDADGVTSLALELRADGTYTATSGGDLCGAEGTWSTVGPESGSAFEARGVCDGRIITFAAPARPERLDGEVSDGSDLIGTFAVTYRPATVDRPLTESELELVGEWVGTLTGPEGSTAGTVTLRDDGTFTSIGESDFFERLDGHWELTPTGLVSWTGTSSGFTVRSIGSVDSDTIDGTWSSSGGGGRKFSGSMQLERGE